MIHVQDRNSNRVEERNNQRQEFLIREKKPEKKVTTKRKPTEKAGK